MWKELRRDMQAVMERDPSVRSVWEVILAYPGFHALQLHRVSHFLYRRSQFAAARFVSHLARFFTGVEIHPGARIGSGVLIDHGMGTVIGETAVIEDDVTLYQGVTLGGTGKEKGQRHPRVKEGAVVACGAKVLGSFTVGRNARIGAGAVVLRSVPENSTVVGVPGRVVVQNGQRVSDLNHHQAPDPVARQLECLQAQVSSLQRQIEALEADKEPHGRQYGESNPWQLSS